MDEAEHFNKTSPVPFSHNKELIEHRLNELESITKEINGKIHHVDKTTTRIEAGMITKSQLIYTALTIFAACFIAISGWLILILKSMQ